jgi:hypothetical protein
LLKEECCKTELTDKDNNCLCVKLVNQAKINIKKNCRKVILIQLQSGKWHLGPLQQDKLDDCCADAIDEWWSSLEILLPTPTPPPDKPSL